MSRGSSPELWSFPFCAAVSVWWPSGTWRCGRLPEVHDAGSRGRFPDCGRLRLQWQCRCGCPLGPGDVAVSLRSVTRCHVAGPRRCDRFRLMWQCRRGSPLGPGDVVVSLRAVTRCHVAGPRSCGRLRLMWQCRRGSPLGPGYLVV